MELLKLARLHKSFIFCFSQDQYLFSRPFSIHNIYTARYVLLQSLEPVLKPDSGRTDSLFGRKSTPSAKASSPIPQRICAPDTPDGEPAEQAHTTANAQVEEQRPREQDRSRREP